MKIPTYQTNLPAAVRLDQSLSAHARLLYSEIHALCDQQGYCWASNQYFASLYGVKRKAISRWIQQLSEHGYIRLEISPSEGNLRRIYPTSYPLKRDDLSSWAGTGHSLKEDSYPPKKTPNRTRLLTSISIDNNDRVDQVSSQKGIVKKEDSQERNEAADGLPSTSHKKSACLKDKPPSLEEVATYMQGQTEICPHRSTAQDQGQRFINYYQSNGWMVGRHAMQDWQAAARNWLLNSKTYETTQRSPTRHATQTPEESSRSKDYSIPL
uniref:Helix-turn-helix domain-containing protein n=1 Tax=Roseihalotalea indica TaxID=2867963 RepID=A0AA49JIC8_9BACT|nr:helix-turn-helix domain-containing protein [Tunicatimonas sp. TK19036]